VEAHFGQMKKLGANVVRIHLQLGKFMDGPDKANQKALDRLWKLLQLAEKERLYLDLTGLGCYHKTDVPAWYDKLTEQKRWDVQARFWRAIAGRCADSPTVFCYDLMNEPVVPGGRRKDGDWLGPPFGGKHFVQFITLDQQDRPRPDIARQWVHHLAVAIREKDKRHLITVGLVDWSLDRPGLTSGFVPEKVADDLDFGDEDNPFVESLCYFNDRQALANTSEQRIFVVDTVQMKVETELSLEGHEPRPIGEYYPRLAKEAGLGTDISWFTRLGDVIVFVYRRDRNAGLEGWQDGLLWLRARS
jgi:Cellulase (glycosyl hydrolase family 5)